MLRDKDAAKEKKRREEEEKLALAPVASLMYEEIERRMDVFIFRCCFAHSVYEARRMIIHGRVLLNGKKVRAVSIFFSCVTDRILAFECEHSFGTR